MIVDIFFPCAVVAGAAGNHRRTLSRSSERQKNETSGERG